MPIKGILNLFYNFYDLYFFFFNWNIVSIQYYVKFQVYYVVIWPLHTLWNVHHDKFSNPIQSYYIIIDHIPYAIYCIPVAYFITRGLYLFILFTYFMPPIPSPQATTCSFSLSLNQLYFVLAVYLFYFLYSTISEIVMIFVSLSDLFHLAQ